MLTLNTTDKSLEMKLSAAGSIPFYTCWNDVTTTSYLPGAGDGYADGTSPVTIIEAPGADTKRVIKAVNILNSLETSTNINIRINDGGVFYDIINITLSVGDSLQYIDTKGWFVLDSVGTIKISGDGIPPTFSSGQPTTLSCSKPNIRFIVADEKGVKQNTIDVFINGQIAVHGGNFIAGFRGAASSIDPWSGGGKDGYFVTIAPDTNLTLSASHTDAYAVDAKGNVSSYNWSWEADVAGPYSFSNQPVNGATSVAVTSPIYINIIDDGYGVDLDTVDAYVGGGWAYKYPLFKDGYNSDESDAYAITGGLHLYIKPEYTLPESSVIRNRIYASDACSNDVLIEWSFTTKTWTATYDEKIYASDGVDGYLFGYYCDIYRNWILVSTYENDAYGVNAGMAYLFKNEDGTWTQRQKICGNDIEAGDIFGFSCSIDGDFAVVSARDEDEEATNAGAAYVFKKTETEAWTQIQKLTASDAAESDAFGSSVNVCGEYIIVGARSLSAGPGKGKAYIFKYNGSTFDQTDILEASDKEAGDQFGNAVAIHDDMAIVGAPQEDAYGSGAGAAYIFVRTGGTWAEQQKINGTDSAAGDQFGLAVDIDGYYCIVGAVTENADDRGAAYVFKRTGNHWGQQQKIVSTDLAAGDQFGKSVGLERDTCVVGAFREGAGGTNAGAAYVFTRSESTWTQRARLDAPDIKAADFFGQSVAVYNENIIVGSRAADGKADTDGAVYIWKKV